MMVSPLRESNRPSIRVRTSLPPPFRPKSFQIHPTHIQRTYLVLSKYQPFPGQNLPQGPIPSEVTALRIPTNIANAKSSFSHAHELQTAQHSLNGAAASTFPNASSLVRGLPYFDSALGLTREFLEASKQGKQGKQQVARVSGSDVVDFAYDDHYAMPKDDAGFAATAEKGHKHGKRVRNSSAVMFEDKAGDGELISLESSAQPVHDWTPRQFANGRFYGYDAGDTKLRDEDEWITLNGEFAPTIAQKQQKADDNDKTIVASQPALGKTLPKKKEAIATATQGQNEEENEDNVNSIFVANQPARTEPSSNKKRRITDASSTTKKAATTRKKPAGAGKKAPTADKKPVANKNPVAATPADPTTPAKRRGGRPLGYRKKADGTWGFPDDSTVTPPSKGSKSKPSSSSGGDKRRKAPAADAAGTQNRKRQRKEPAAKDGAVEKDEDKTFELKSGASSV